MGEERPVGSESGEARIRRPSKAGGEFLAWRPRPRAKLRNDSANQFIRALGVVPPMGEQPGFCEAPRPRLLQCADDAERARGERVGGG